VRQLLAFARRQPLDPAPFSVYERLTELMPLLEKAVGAHVHLELKCSEDVWPAFADASQFENAVLNLVLNAKDALRDDKTIVIEAVNVLVGQRSPFDEVLVPGDYVALSVTDHGTGMTPDVASRAIEPFFTTKDAGHGIGLGLSTVFGFSKQSGGHLDIRSEPDKGTVVTLYLPRPFGDGRKDPSNPRSNGALGGDERILVVEDDALVRVFLDNALTQLGYRVIAVAGAEEALSLLGSHSEIDLVIADVIGGREFVAKLESSHPDLAVLFISGLPDKASGDADKPEGRFEVQDIAKRIRETLDKS
jgi:CheY-like chemotaxis protein